MSGYENKRSLWWVLLPIFFTIFGGIAAYFLLRKDDEYFARFCLQLSVVLSAIELLYFFIIISFIDLPEQIGNTVNV